MNNELNTEIEKSIATAKNENFQLNKERKTEQLWFRVTKNEREQLEKLAADNNTTVSALFYKITQLLLR